MSGLLDRMAKRALGALEGVQPILAPRYAPRGSESHATTFPPETSLEIEAHPPEGRRPEAARSTPEADFIPAPSRAAPAGQAPASSRPKSPALPSHSIDSPATRARAAAPEPTPAAQDGDLAQARAHKLEPSSSVPALPARLAGLPRLSLDAPEDAADATPSARVALRNELGPDARSMRGGIEPLDLAAAEEARPIRSDPQAKPDGKLRQSLSRMQPAPAAHRAKPVEQNTEVHITIGSIELRAPHPEPKAPRASFRPRVTLDDFLRRRQEGRP